jgi:hypothetical protein
MPNETLNAYDQTSPIHYRWRIGPSAPAVTGPVTSGVAGAQQLTAIVGERSLQFLAFELAVGLPNGPGDIYPIVGGASNPVNSPLVVDLQRSTDGGNTWASLFAGSTNGLPTLSPGRAFSRLSQSFGNTLCNPGDYLRASVVDCDGIAQNVSFTCFGRCIKD